MKWRRAIIEATLIGLVALVLRLINLGTWPRWYVDEGIYAIRGINILHGTYGYINWYPQFLSPLMPPIFGLMEMLFGKDYLFTRLPTAVMGSFSCVLLYLIGAKLYNRFVGIVASLILAIASVPINRMAMIDNGVEFFFLLTVFFCLKGRDDERQRWSYLMGIAAGLAFLSKYTGVAALIFIVVQSLADKSLSRVWRSLPAFVAVALVSPLIGLIVNWDAFVFDTIEYGPRPPQLVLLLDLFVKGNYGSQLQPPAIYYNLWSTLGFVMLFYLLGRGRFGDRLCVIWAAAILATYVVYGRGFWVFLVVLYPVYSLAIATALHDMVYARGNLGALVTFALFLALPVFSYQHLYPSLAADWGRYLFLGTAAIVFLLLLVRQPTLPLPLRSWGWLSNPRHKKRGQDILRTLALVPLIAVILAGSLFELKPIFASNDVADQRATVDWLNANVKKGDTVAAATPIIQLLTKALGIYYADVVLYTTGEEFLEHKKELLSRYKMDSSLGAMDYFVTDTPLQSFGPPGPKIAKAVKEKWLQVFEAGDYRVYRNPDRIGVHGVSLLDDDMAEGTTVEIGGADRVALADDAIEKRSGQNFLRLEIDLRGDNAIYLRPGPNPEDWSNYTEISFWWYGDNTGIVAVDILTPDWESYYHLPFVDNWKGWRLVWLPFGAAFPIGEPSWDTVQTLALKFQSLPAVGTTRIDDLRLR